MNSIIILNGIPLTSVMCVSFKHVQVTVAPWTFWESLLHDVHYASHCCTICIVQVTIAPCALCKSLLHHVHYASHYCTMCIVQVTIAPRALCKSRLHHAHCASHCCTMCNRIDYEQYSVEISSSSRFTPFINFYQLQWVTKVLAHPRKTL